MPVRVIKKSGASIVGSFPSFKLGTSVRYESTLERDLLYHLEFDQNVLWYEMQPFTIRKTMIDGRLRKYTPDCQITHSDFGNAILECKAEGLLLKESTLQQLQIGSNWADENEHEFFLATETALRTKPRLENLKILYRYHRLTIPYNIVEKCLEILNASTCGQSLNSLLNQITDHKPWRIKPFIWSLIFHHHISIDLDQPLTDKSLLYAVSPESKRRSIWDACVSNQELDSFLTVNGLSSARFL